jgi:DNA-binding NtrC family response regulator
MSSSARDALTLLNAKTYDAIISGYKMPDIDGIAFLKLLKGSGNTLPFILSTGRGREEVVIEAINSGAEDKVNCSYVLRIFSRHLASGQEYR